MEFFMVLLGLAIVICISWLSKKFWTKVSGVEKRAFALGESEVELNEIIVISPDVKFKSFSMVSRGEGRLFYTTEGRVLFTSLNGKEVGLDLSYDRIQGLEVDEGSVFKAPKLIINYETEARAAETMSFKFPQGQGGNFMNDIKNFKQWISELNGEREKK
jgi:hypothetical protein